MIDTSLSSNFEQKYYKKYTISGNFHADTLKYFVEDYCSNATPICFWGHQFDLENLKQKTKFSNFNYDLKLTIIKINDVIFKLTLNFYTQNEATFLDRGAYCCGENNWGSNKGLHMLFGQILHAAVEGECNNSESHFLAKNWESLNPLNSIELKAKITDNLKISFMKVVKIISEQIYDFISYFVEPPKTVIRCEYKKYEKKLKSEKEDPKEENRNNIETLLETSHKEKPKKVYTDLQLKSAPLSKESEGALITKVIEPSITPMMLAIGSTSITPMVLTILIGISSLLKRIQGNRPIFKDPLPQVLFKSKLPQLMEESSNLKRLALHPPQILPEPIFPESIFFCKETIKTLVNLPNQISNQYSPRPLLKKRTFKYKPHEDSLDCEGQIPKILPRFPIQYSSLPLLKKRIFNHIPQEDGIDLKGQISQISPEIMIKPVKIFPSRTLSEELMSIQRYGRLRGKVTSVISRKILLKENKQNFGVFSVDILTRIANLFLFEIFKESNSKEVIQEARNTLINFQRVSKSWWKACTNLVFDYEENILNKDFLNKTKYFPLDLQKSIQKITESNSLSVGLFYLDPKILSISKPNQDAIASALPSFCGCHVIYNTSQPKVYRFLENDIEYFQHPEFSWATVLVDFISWPMIENVSLLYIEDPRKRPALAIPYTFSDQKEEGKGIFVIQRLRVDEKNKEWWVLIDKPISQKSFEARVVCILNEYEREVSLENTKSNSSDSATIDSNAISKNYLEWFNNFLSGQICEDLPSSNEGYHKAIPSERRVKHYKG